MLGGSSVGREGLELENGLGEVVRTLSVAGQISFVGIRFSLGGEEFAKWFLPDQDEPDSGHGQKAWC